jgi:predicted RNase H-like nuclease (RuvC/YqgF family)
MVLPEAVTAIQLVSNLISSGKTARELAKDSTDHKLKGAISDLYDAILDVKQHVLKLDEENRSLQTALAEKNKYIGPVQPHGYYFQGEDHEHPLCPRCFQMLPQKIAFMSEPEQWNRGVRRTCKLCGEHIYEIPMKFN